LPARELAPESEQLAERFRRQLAACIEEDESGRPTPRVNLPDRSALERAVQDLAGWVPRQRLRADLDPRRDLEGREVQGQEGPKRARDRPMDGMSSL
jgi:hypothetical protein